MEARVAVTGAAGHAVRATGVEDALRGQQPTDENIAAARAAEGIEPLDAIHASADYRVAMAQVFATRALQVARQRAGG